MAVGRGGPGVLGLLPLCDRLVEVDAWARQACSHQGALREPTDRARQVSGLRCLAGACSHIAKTGSRVEDGGSRALPRSRMDSGSPDRRDCASGLPGLAAPTPAQGGACHGLSAQVGNDAWHGNATGARCATIRGWPGPGIATCWHHIVGSAGDLAGAPIIRRCRYLHGREILLCI